LNHEVQTLAEKLIVTNELIATAWILTKTN
jgi:hypothetical protein